MLRLQIGYVWYMDEHAGKLNFRVQKSQWLSDCDTTGSDNKQIWLIKIQSPKVLWEAFGMPELEWQSGTVWSDCVASFNATRVL